MSETTQDSTQPVPEAPVQRFRLRSIPDTNLHPHPDGDWVRYEDYEEVLLLMVQQARKARRAEEELERIKLMKEVR